MQGLFNRSNETRPAESKQDDRAETKDDAEFKPLPNLPSNGQTQSSATENANGPFADKALPAMPAAHDPHQRASMSLPPNTSFNPTTGRFYSQAQPEETPYSAQHTRSQSQPLMFGTPLSPIAPSESDRSGSRSPRMHDLEDNGSTVVQESHLSQEQAVASSQQKPDEASYTEQLPGPTLSPSPSIESRKAVPNQPETSTTTETAPKDNSVSATSSLSTHPHRNEARSLNETTEPVELAMTKDDSSEEIVMSPTAYPGQEWTPMHI